MLQIFLISLFLKFQRRFQGHDLGAFTVYAFAIVSYVLQVYFASFRVSCQCTLQYVCAYKISVKKLARGGARSKFWENNNVCVLTYIAVRFDTTWLFIKSLDLRFHFFQYQRRFQGYILGEHLQTVFTYMVYIGMKYDFLPLVTIPDVCPPFLLPESAYAISIRIFRFKLS